MPPATEWRQRERQQCWRHILFLRHRMPCCRQMSRLNTRPILSPCHKAPKTFINIPSGHMRQAAEGKATCEARIKLIYNLRAERSAASPGPVPALRQSVVVVGALSAAFHKLGAGHGEEAPARVPVRHGSVAESVVKAAAAHTRCEAAVREGSRRMLVPARLADRPMAAVVPHSTAAVVAAEAPVGLERLAILPACCGGQDEHAAPGGY